MIAGVLLAQLTTPTLEWDRIARRHAAVYLDGLRGPQTAPHAGAARLTRVELEHGLSP